jgi:hypothetical protein
MKDKIELRFKIVALLVFSSNMPDAYQNKVEIVAKAIDRKSQYAEQFVTLLESQVLNFLETVNCCNNYHLN